MAEVTGAAAPDADADAAVDSGIDPGGAGRRRPFASPWWWRAPLIVLVLLVGYYVVTLFQVVAAGRSDDARPAGAIVVLGAAQYDGRPSPQLAARLDHAVELWEAGIAPRVMVTGGKQDGDRFTEAEASRRYLVEHGVPDGAILAEDAGRTTYESLDAAAAVLREQGLRDVVLVTDPYHALRSELIAKEVGLRPHVSPTPTSVVHGWASARRHLKEAAGVAIGRIVGFQRLSGIGS